MRRLHVEILRRPRQETQPPQDDGAYSVEKMFIQIKNGARGDARRLQNTRLTRSDDGDALRKPIEALESGRCHDPGILDTKAEPPIDIDRGLD